MTTMRIKKEYTRPEVEVINLVMKPLLTASILIDTDSSDEIDDPESIL